MKDEISITRPNMHSHSQRHTFFIARKRSHLDIMSALCVSWLSDVRKFNISLKTSSPQSSSHLTSKRPRHQSNVYYWSFAHITIDERRRRMPFYWSKGFGGRRAGGTITADRHGVRRPVFRFRICGLNCFR